MPYSYQRRHTYNLKVRGTTSTEVEALARQKLDEYYGESDYEYEIDASAVTAETDGGSTVLHVVAEVTACST